MRLNRCLRIVLRGNLSSSAVSLISAAVSVAVYAVLLGIPYALGLAVLLLVHELGHMLAAACVGIRASWPVLIPFLGAFINLRRLPVNAKMEADIALGGPAAGTLSALFCLSLYGWQEQRCWLILAYTASMLNLFNLIPCRLLDGGRIAAAVSGKFGWTGAGILLALLLCSGSLLVGVMFLAALYDLRAAEQQEDAYYCLSAAQRFTILCRYFSLVAVLSILAAYMGKII